MGRSKPYPPEFKAQVLAAVATGQSVNSVAKEFGVGRATITAWQTESGLTRPADVGQQKKQELGEQLFGYVQESITTLEFLVKFSRNETWLQKQSANDVAVLFGVLSDKTIRILGALQPNSDNGVDQ